MKNGITMSRLAQAFIAATLAGTAQSQVATVTPDKDNTLYESPLGLLSNGIGSGMFCGTDLEFVSKRAIMHFDVASAVPAGSTITGVKLILNFNMGMGTPSDCALHGLQKDWGEAGSSASGGQGGGAPAKAGDATWIHTFSPTGKWTKAGGDFDAASDSTVNVTIDGIYTWPAPGGSDAAMVARVQAWLDNPASNFGWVLIGSEAILTSAKRIATRESASPPKLEVTYDAPAQCYADCDMSGSLDFFDFLCFQNEFANGTAFADCDMSGSLDFFDFLCFQNAFAAGCP